VEKNLHAVVAELGVDLLDQRHRAAGGKRDELALDPEPASWIVVTGGPRRRVLMNSPTSASLPNADMGADIVLRR